LVSIADQFRENKSIPIRSLDFYAYQHRITWQLADRPTGRPACRLLESPMKTPLHVRATALVVAVMLTTVLTQALALFALPASGDVMLAQAATAIHQAR
jgi:hypothetical protein